MKASVRPRFDSAVVRALLVIGGVAGPVLTGGACSSPLSAESKVEPVLPNPSAPPPNPNTPSPSPPPGQNDNGVTSSAEPSETDEEGVTPGPIVTEPPPPAVGPAPAETEDVTFGEVAMGGNGASSDRYAKADVTRDGQNYFLMANGWGPGFESQSISWNGTSFTVENMAGNEGPNYQPASYPTVFCGAYSDSVSGACGLPAALDSMTALRTGWSWQPNDNAGEYNAAYDIWLGTGPARNTFSGYLMVWYREPPGQQPAGMLTFDAVEVANVPGTWDIWTGRVGNRPIINWVRAEGDDTLSMEFDVLDFVRDAQARGLEVPGTHVLSVAVGFEIWTGPIERLESVDFYVDVQ